MGQAQDTPERLCLCGSHCCPKTKAHKSDEAGLLSAEGGLAQKKFECSYGSATDPMSYLSVFKTGK